MDRETINNTVKNYADKYRNIQSELVDDELTLVNMMRYMDDKQRKALIKFLKLYNRSSLELSKMIRKFK